MEGVAATAATAALVVAMGTVVEGAMAIPWQCNGNNGNAMAMTTTGIEGTTTTLWQW